MKTLIVNASSKSKITKNEAPYLTTGESFQNLITKANASKLQDARLKVLKLMKVESGPDIGNAEIEKIAFLPAYQRYSGRTYSRITNEAWQKLIDQPEKFDFVILSALYGLIRYDEPIRNYSIRQDDKLPDKTPISKFWNNQGISNWLYDYIKQNDFDDVKFVLSTSYSAIVDKEHLINRLTDELGIQAEDKQMKSTGMKSMLLRGDYINNFLIKN